VGQLISSLGDKLLHLNALAVAVTAAQHAGSFMGQVLLWSTVPALLLSSVAGLAADRWSRKGIMVGTDLLRAGLVACLPLAALAGQGWIFAVIALVASASCFFGPAKLALLPSTVSSQQLVRANGYLATGHFVMALVGTALGGMLIAWLGVRGSLWMNAGVFLLSALALSRLRLGYTSPATTVPMALFWTPLRQTWRQVQRRATLRHLIVHYALLMALIGASYVGLVGLAGRLHWTMLHLSGVLTAAMLGMGAGTWWAGRTSQPSAQRMLVGLLSVLAGALVLMMTSTLLGVALAAALLGAGVAMEMAVVDASFQRAIPSHQLGRFVGLRAVVANLAMIVAAPASGWVIDRLGSAALFGGVAAVAVVLLGGVLLTTLERWFYPAFRWVFRQLAFAYFRLDVQGLQHIPSEGPVILAANHPNVLDGFLLMLIAKRRVRFLMAEHMYTHPILAPIHKACGVIPVYHDTTNGGALRGAVAALQRGEVLGIYPEGTTVEGGRMTTIKKGVGILALRTGAPVVPIAFEGSDHAYPRGQKIPRPSVIRIRCGQPVSFAAVEAPMIPEMTLTQTLETIRRSILHEMRILAHTDVAPRWPALIKELQIALSSLIIWPLASVLMATAHPTPDIERR